MSVPTREHPQACPSETNPVPHPAPQALAIPSILESICHHPLPIGLAALGVWLLKPALHPLDDASVFLGLLASVLLAVKLGGLSWGLSQTAIGSLLGAFYRTTSAPPDHGFALVLTASLLLAFEGLLLSLFITKQDSTERSGPSSNSIRPSRLSRLLRQAVPSCRLDPSEPPEVRQQLLKSEENYQRLLDLANEGICQLDASARFVHVNCRLLGMFGYRVEDLLDKPAETLVFDDDIPAFRDHLRKRQVGVSEHYEFRFRRADGQPLWAIVSATSLQDSHGRFLGSLAMLTDVTDRRRAEQDYQGLFEHASEGLFRATADGRFLRVNPAMARIFGYESPQQMIDEVQSIETQLYIDPESRRDFFRQLHQTGSLSGFESPARRRDGQEIWISESGRALLDAEGSILCYEGIVEDVSPRKKAEAEIQQLNLRLGRRLDWVNALRRVDSAIANGGDLNSLLDVVLQQAAQHLYVQAASFLIARPDDTSFEVKAAIGVHSSALRRGRVRFDSGLLARVIENRRSLLLDLNQQHDYPRASQALAEGFSLVLVVPLIARGRVQGAFEILSRTPIDSNPDWREAIETLASQAALAIDNDNLLEDLHHSHAELTAAYEATIEGWARVLDLRDKETEGHSQRVTDMTVRLARSLGIPEAELVHVRRGALLHDIGKMGIPDHILLKPGPLSDDEWAIMRRHPTYAYEMLSPIAFLRPALDIPQNHHEHLDGSGYPRGLKGDQIPLTARIFAAVDVWDALSHDRPYRNALPPDQVRAHIASLAGSHLDPNVVHHFLALLDDQPVPSPQLPVDPCFDTTSDQPSYARPALPLDEPQRLDDLLQYRILDTDPEEPFDKLARLAANLCDTPIALISLVDANRQWFKSRVGLSTQETCRDVSFCAHAILQDDLFIVSDTLADPRFQNNPLVLADPRIRFYAGAPLISSQGHALGTLCVIDQAPRALSSDQKTALTTLARQVVSQIELRRVVADLQQQMRERSRIEQDLRNQKAFYLSLVQNLPHKVFRKDLDGRFTFANDHFCADLGLQLDSILGFTDFDLFPAYLASQYRFDDRRVIHSRKPLDVVESHHLRSGKISYVHTVKVPILDDDGQPVGVQGMFADVTERVLAERALRDGEARFRAFMEHSPCIAFIKNESSTYEYVNERFEELFQTPASDIPGLSDFEIFSEPDARRHQQDDRRVLDSGQPTQLVETVECPDGFMREFLTVKFPFLDSSGRRMLGGVSLDITQQKALERTLADQLSLAERLNSELARKSRRLEQVNALLVEQATTDPLTGLRNRRAFFESLEAALSERDRHPKPLSVLMLDVDNFKAYNDDFGHPAGDEVLRVVASLLTSHARAHDLPARYGGEEFVILLPNSSADDAIAAAERLLDAIALYPWPLRSVTASFGVASLDHSQTLDAHSLLEIADRALYHSKRSGRNRVTHLRDIPPLLTSTRQ